MNDIQKFLDGAPRSNNLNLAVDVEKDSDHQRIVVGFATLDNVDLTDDVITAEASLKAFEEFRGNVRVQHDKLRPVGKVVDFRPSSYFDVKTNKEYQGIQVAVQVSEAAEDVWKMCLDGTLSGFSIGGAVKRMAPEYREDINKTVQVIHEYQLTELSLVDSPANHLANVQTVYKSIDGNPEGTSSIKMYGGIQKVLEIEMKGDSPQMAEEITKDSENAEVVDEVVTEPATEEVVAEETVTEEPEAVEAGDEVTEEVVAEAKPTLEEVIENLSAQIASQNETVAKSVSESVALQLGEVKKEFDSRFEALEEAQKKFDAPINELREKLVALESSLGATEKRLDGLATGGAIQKSLEAVAETETVVEETSTFGGVFSSKYESK